MTDSKTTRGSLATQLTANNKLCRQRESKLKALLARGMPFDKADRKSGALSAANRRWRTEELALKRGGPAECLIVLERRNNEDLPIGAEISELLARASA